MKITPDTVPAPVYPACFAGMDLDSVNYALSQGMATEDDARALVLWWNESGKRFTRATLCHRSRPMGAARVVIPYISITG